MTQEEKGLLLKDLSARLPYEVVIQEYNEEYGYSDNVLNNIERGYFSVHEPAIVGTWINRIENVRPYLRPMSSMTKEEKILFNQLLNDGAFYEVEDFCNQRHLDYRGLIPKGLAIEVTEDNNPYKK